MKVQVYYTGKTSEQYLRTGEEIYARRLGHYLPITFTVLPDIKQAGKLSPEQLIDREGQALLAKINPDDRLVLLDEGGSSFGSVAFAEWLERELHRPARRLVFVVGGAFGFSRDVYNRADQLISLSPMTFSHQMVRLFFTEQLYRAMTIIRNEKYHNE
ncbi:23S rRNA (pseudouridine1915-N3)-methyltransferase [Lewinella marina]|uniref:Ribosomal RNA large subunit methyltransferase H n=1 Tax=Neolewinella marina TaxID=438751 RepID=A0A2G0CHR1_9BACT|nr:23S rRNA (pseudouridine(1915)-N(3))-methyltransferase RlmH [Neolewinella marina]NJB85389.1 23S rRNA (pseudouridine1915-N3)-methyltransferase [Neolewinella marina]PHK99498.1 23S rRNA (pseudouridine(1915)-N(3))-methyltransferase RlmH [Neolewinella marina]